MADRDSRLLQKKKSQPFSHDGRLFSFVPIAAETVSVLKRQDDKLCVCSGRSQKMVNSLSGLPLNPDAETAAAPRLRSRRRPAAQPP